MADSQRFTGIMQVLMAGTVCLAGFTQAADARSLFEVFAESDDGSITVDGSGSSLIDLVDDLINSNDDFSALQGEDFSANLNYADVDQALRFDVFEDGGEWVIVLESDLTGLREEFRGATRSDVEDELEDWLKKDGSSEYAKFQEAIQKRSLVGVLDGNPNATTALLAQQSFRRFGMSRAKPDWFTGRQGVGDPTDADPESSWWFRVVGVGSFADAGGYNVNGGGAAFDTGTWLTDNVGLSFGSTVIFMDVSGAAVVHAGLEAAVPIRLLNREPLNDTGDVALTWQITPLFNLGGAGSADMIAGGMMWGVGATNQFVLGLGGLDLAFGTQLTHYEGLRLRSGDYEFKPEVDQQVLMNGVLATYAIADDFFIDGGVSYSRFLNDAAVQDWISPTAGFGMRLGERGILSANYTASFGEKSYRNHQLMVGVNLPF